jgi:hypothetical protein
MFKKYIVIGFIASCIMLGIASCNKDIVTDKVINVTLHGYNISDTQLLVSLDTVQYNKNLLRANGQVSFSMVYPYSPGKKEATIHVKNPQTGKEMFQQSMPLNGSQLEFFYPLVNINGKLLDVNPPAADPATNKLGFYIYYPESNDPIDIFIFNANTWEMAYLAKNVIPQTWVYIDYKLPDGFTDKNIIGGCTINFTKAGTTDQWAFNGDEYQSQVSAFSLTLPHAGNNGNIVQPYFILPSPNGWQAEVANLFLRPKGY